MEKYDVIIIGGGLIGLATAYYLSKSQVKCLVLEKSELSREATGRNGGSLHFQLEHRLIKNSAEDAKQIAHILPLTLAAIADWQGLEAELQSHIEVVMDGGLMVAETKSDIALLEMKKTLEEAHGLPTEILTSADVRKIAPYVSDRIKAAGFFNKEGRANPRLVPEAFAFAATKNGVVIKAHTEVLAIEQEGKKWRLHTKMANQKKSKDFISNKVINASGIWCRKIAAMIGINVEMSPVPLLMNVTTQMPPSIPHLIQHVSKNLSLKQVSDGNILIGGGWPARMKLDNGHPNFDVKPSFIPENIQSNLSIALQVVPQLTNSHLLRCWTGIAGITPDELPYLGEFSGAPGMFIAGGGSAFTLGPTLARLLAGKVLGHKDPFDLTLFHPDRFLKPPIINKGIVHAN